MKNIYLNIYKPNFINLKKAKKNIENNNVIGVPTETVYGLAGNAYSNISINKIYKLKKRPKINPANEVMMVILGLFGAAGHSDCTGASIALRT